MSELEQVPFFSVEFAENLSRAAPVALARSEWYLTQREDLPCLVSKPRPTPCSTRS